MELMYSVKRKPLKCEPPQLENVLDPDVIRPICVVSCGNIVAFSSPTDLADAEGDTWGGHVYVCDLDTPWDAHKVTSTDYPVSALEWDNEGRQLLVATLAGEVSVYGQKEFLLNDWTCLYTTTFPGEHIIKGTFFHNGRRIVALDKKPDAPIAERIQVLRPTPTVKGFGGAPASGVCVVARGGLVGCALSGAGAGTARPPPSAHRPPAQRAALAHAALAHKNGNILLASICATDRRAGRHCVRCAVITVSSAAPHAVTVQPLPTVHLPSDAPPSSISWLLRDDADTLLVAGKSVALWKLAERAHPVHKLLSKGPVQGNTTPGGGGGGGGGPKAGADCFNVLTWQQCYTWAHPRGAAAPPRAVHVASGAPLGPAGPAGPPHLLLVSAKQLHLLPRDELRYIHSKTVISDGSESDGGGGGGGGGATQPKKPKHGSSHNQSASGAGAGAGAGVSLACCCVTALGGAAVTIDTRAQLYVFKLTAQHNHPDIPAPAAAQHAAALLEYALVTGVDCLDVLLTLNPQNIEAVYERLTESFQRQPPPFQQYYYHSWLKLRIALCRLVPNRLGSVSWLSCLQSLHAAWGCAGAALRPDDKDAGAAAAALLDSDTDADKALINLEAKTEVPVDTSLLQALRRPLQQAVDIAVTILASPHHTHGCELFTEPGAMLLLRRVLVLARAVGCGGGEPALGRLLARLQAPAPKPDLLEECAAVSAVLSRARVWEAPPRCAVSAPAPGNKPPHVFEYGVEPDQCKFAPEPPAYAQSETTPTCEMDCIRYMYVGSVSWRQCARCGARSLGASVARTPPPRHHHARFLPRCRCGGTWSLVLNV